MAFFIFIKNMLIDANSDIVKTFSNVREYEKGLKL